VLEYQHEIRTSKKKVAHHVALAYRYTQFEIRLEAHRAHRLYESFLAGCANRMARGAPVDVDKIPEPDAGTLEYVVALRKKVMRTQDEQEFLDYFDLLEEIRSALTGGLA
jgi:hypothetical protein